MLTRYSKKDITTYAFYLEMRYTPNLDFDTIFSGKDIISAIIHRYDLQGNFNPKVLELLPFLGYYINTEDQLNELVEKLTNDLIEKEFIELVTTSNSIPQYIKISEMGE